MATLTWQNVAAPDFRPAMEGVRNATTLLSNAFDRAGDTVDQFTKARTDAADRAVMQRMLGLQDPEAYQQALADKSLLGEQAGRVSTATLANLDSRVGSLLNNAVRQNQVDQGIFNLDRDKYKQNRLESDDAAMDAAGPIIQQAQILQRQGKEDEATQLLSTLQKLRPGLFAEVVKSVDNTGTNALSRGQSIQNMGHTQWRFGNEQAQYGEARAGDALADEIAQRAPDAQTAAQYLDASGASAAVKQRALARLGTMGYQGVYGPLGSSGTGGTSGTSGSSGMANPASVMTGGKALPDNIRTVGDMVDTLDSRGLNSTLLKDNPAGTATGLYQITGGTFKEFAPKALGDNWRNADIRDPSVQDRVAEAIWDSAKGDAARIHGRWKSISEEQAKSLVNKPWSEVRDTISAGETSSHASQILAQAIDKQGNAFGTKQVNQRLAERAAENFAATETTPEQYLSDLNDRASPREVAKRLSAEGGEFAGANTDWLESQISRMQDQSKGEDGRVRLTPAQIGRMMIQSSTQADSGFSRLGRWIAGPRGWNDYGDSFALLFGGSPNLGDRRMNDRELAERMRQYLSGQTGTGIEATQSLGNVNQEVTKAQAAYEAAEQQLARIRAAGKGRPGFQASIQLAEASRNTALQTLKQAQGGVPANSGLVPTRDRTTPVSVDRPAGVSEKATRGPLGLWWVSPTDEQETRR